MLKLLMHRGDRKLLVLGLTGENITRLLAAEPAVVNLDEFGITGIDLVIDYGKTGNDLIDAWLRLGLLDEGTANRLRQVPVGGRVEGP